MGLASQPGTSANRHRQRTPPTQSANATPPSCSAKLVRQVGPPSHSANGHRQARSKSRVPHRLLTIASEAACGIGVATGDLRQFAPPTDSANTLRQHTPPTHSANTLRQHTPPSRSANHWLLETAPKATGRRIKARLSVLGRFAHSTKLLCGAGSPTWESKTRRPAAIEDRFPCAGVAPRVSPVPFSILPLANQSPSRFCSFFCGIRARLRGGD